MKIPRVLILTAALTMGLQGGLSVMAEFGAENRVADGKKVVLEFSILVPESHTVIPNNLAEYVQGQKQLLPALQQALMGMKPGESKRVDLPAEQAFGPYDERKKTTMTRDELPRNLAPGAVLTNRNGEPFTVVAVSDQAAVVDFNHPLAGKHLVFDVKILKVEDVS